MRASHVDSNGRLTRLEEFESHECSAKQTGCHT